jgi:hypothetical protein
MAEWTLVPCLVTLRTEYNTVSPNRDKGADGSIGDSAHTSSSDHTPDEDSDILRDHDSDSKNEVHALDIDSSGPWPGGAAWFDAAIKAIVERHRTGKDNRLQYVIWNKKIASRSIDNWRWRDYSQVKKDPHTNHAHFSARYTTPQENDTSSWGVSTGNEEDDMAWTDEISITADTAKEVGKKSGEKVQAGTLLQLAVIYAARGDDKASAANDRAGAAVERADEALAALAELKQMLGMIPGSSDGEVAAALRAVLGDRASSIGAILTSK